MTVCFLAAFSDRPCDGRLIRAHLIPKQLLKRHGVDPWDERSWVPACGGLTGCSGHHGALDVARTLRVPREALPACIEELAADAGLGWWLDRTYGEKEMAA